MASYLGLDIGSDSIKVVEMAKAGRGYALLNYGVAPTPPEALSAGTVQDPQMIGEAIRQLLSSRKIKTKRVVSSVQGQQAVVVRIIEVPQMGRKDLDETMQYEVERHIPFAANQIIMDYAKLDRPGEPTDQPNMEVLFAAVQEDVVLQHVNALRQAKLKPTAIDVQPLALTHSMVQLNGGGLGETVALVNFGATQTDLSIIKDGLLHFPRTIPIGGRSVTQRISEGLGVSVQQAERLKRQYADMGPLPEHLEAARARPEVVAEPDAFVVPEFQLDDEAFDIDPDESDTGFGGAGVGGLSFDFSEDTGDADDVGILEADDSAPPEASFALQDDESADGPLFDFGTGETDTGGFTLDLDSDVTTEPTAEPGAPRETTDTDSGSFLFSGDDTGEGVADADRPVAADTGTAGETTFDFSIDQPTDSSLGSGSGSGTASAEPGPVTDVGSSFDLGDLDSSDEGISFDLGGADTGEGAFAFDEPTGPPTAQPPAGTRTHTETGEQTFDFGTAEGTEGHDAAEPGAVAAAPTTPLTPEEEERLRVREVIEPLMQELATEIARSLEYYRSRYDGAVVDKVVLVGGSARIEGLATYMEQELGLTVDRGNPLAKLEIRNARLTNEDLNRDAPLLAVAVGLALRELA